MTTSEIESNIDLDATRAGELIAALKLHADEKWRDFVPGRTDYSGNPIPRSGAGFLRVGEGGGLTFMCNVQTDGHGNPRGYWFSALRSDGRSGPQIFDTEADAAKALTWVLMGQECICGACNTPFCAHWSETGRVVCAPSGLAEVAS